MGVHLADPKKCTKCLVHKPRLSFYPHSVAKRGVSAWCKDCTNDTARAAQKLDPAKAAAASRKSKLKMKWGMTLEQFAEQLARQGGCAICGAARPGGRGRFKVDHCHTSGRIRGLLCHLCNVGLGAFADDTDRMLKAIEYLKKGGTNGFAG